MVQLKGCLKNLELDIIVGKTGKQHFSAANCEFRSKQRIPYYGMKIHMPRNTAGPACH